MERPAAVRFGNQDESPTGFEYSQDLSHVGWQVGPVVVRLYRSDNVERAIWERQSGHRTPLDLDSPGLDLLRIGLSRDRDACSRIVQPNDLALRCQCRESPHRRPTTTTNVQNCGSLRHGHLLQRPVGHRGVTQIHRPDDAPAEPTTGLPNLPKQPSSQQNRQYQSEYLKHSASLLYRITSWRLVLAICEAKTCQTSGGELRSSPRERPWRSPVGRLVRYPYTGPKRPSGKPGEPLLLWHVSLSHHPR